MLSMKRQTFYELFGWYGAVVIVLAYILVSINVVSAHGFWFHFLNASGAIGVVLVSWSKKAYQPVVINSFRAATGIGALLSLLVTTFHK